MKVHSSNIEQILASKRMTKSELTHNSGICRQNLSAILKRGTCEPKTAGKLAAGLGVPVSEILAKEV